MMNSIKTAGLMAMVVGMLVPSLGIAAITMSSPVAEPAGCVFEELSSSLHEDAPIRVSEHITQWSDRNTAPVKVRVFMAPGFEMPAGNTIRFLFDKKIEHLEQSSVEENKDLNLQP